MNAPIATEALALSGVACSMHFRLSGRCCGKAVREVDDIAIGRYEQAQKRGNSLKL